MTKLTTAEIMDTALEIVRKNFKTFILYGIGYSVIAFFAVMVLFLLGALFGGLGSLIFSGFLVSDFATVVFIILGVLFFCALISFYFSFAIGYINISAQDILNYKIYTTQLVKKSLTSIFKIFKITVIVTALTAVIGALVVAVVYPFLDSLVKLGTIIDSLASGQQLIAMLLIFLFFLLLFCLAVGYMTLFCFTLQVAVIEKEGAWVAIKRSFKLVQNNFKQIYASFILFTTTTIAINFAVRGIIALLAGLVFLLMNLFKLQGDLYLSTTIYTYSQVPINIASWLLISPITSIMLTLLYFNQRYSSEDYDLKLQLARLKNSQKGEQN
ncbi:MAG: hypothetical protein ACQEP9_03750 [Bacillota bacterium]